jgi:DNA polymerase/3'-5' exonuclease PolX
MKYADELRERLSPACERIQIAGSIRRRQPKVSDIELVAIPKTEIAHVGLWENPEEFWPLCGLIANMRAELAPVKGFKHSRDWKYAQFEYAPAKFIGTAKVDLFLATPETWGCIFTIRTGPAEFTHRLVTPKRQNGLCPSHLRFKDGRIWSGDRALETPEEKDVFVALGLPWLEPWERK